jgi:hypothetical protein
LLEVRELSVDDLVTVEKAVRRVQIPHLQTEKVLFLDHRRNSVASKTVHNEGLNVSDIVPCFEDHNKAADS